LQAIVIQAASFNKHFQGRWFDMSAVNRGKAQAKQSRDCSAVLPAAECLSISSLLVSVTKRQASVKLASATSPLLRRL
jgi:hypothetical protein